MIRQTVYRILDPRAHSPAASLFRWAHHGCVVAGIGTIILMTAPDIEAADGLLLDTVFYVALGFFAIEYLARLYAVPEAPWAHLGQAWRDRRHWIMSSGSLVDIFSTWLTLAALLADVATQSVRLACVIWLFKFVPYSEGLSLLANVIRNARAALLSVFLTFIIVLVVAATLAYVFERDVQPQTFGSIPVALWWTIVTLTTTGYGDAVPITIVGRILAGGVMICGIALFALWAGILANGFAEEIRRRDLLRTWDLVTKVPFFNDIGDGTIAEVARLLRPREVPEGYTIMRRGEPGDCMYFLVSGEVEIRIRPTPRRLGPGDFFGEIALVTGAPRNATAVATRYCVLLSLHLTDFRHLAARKPELTEMINREAARRLTESATAPAIADGAPDAG
ncbi:MAG: cyclic nucleotide-binding domain-containing protein [Alphaproteobacteria bacterium]|nr:cyclic nucleotide-binding domain-containing protein [Alphaproteobacteria bacterium]